MSAQGRFESLGTPVRKGGLMGCVVGPNGHGGEALYFNFNQLSGLLFLVQVDPNGKVYVGIGTEKGDLVVFDPASGQHRGILPKGLRGAKGWSTVSVSRRVDGQVYAEFGPNLMRLDDETATIVERAPERPPL